MSRLPTSDRIWLSKELLAEAMASEAAQDHQCRIPKRQLSTFSSSIASGQRHQPADVDTPARADCIPGACTPDQAVGLDDTWHNHAQQRSSTTMPLSTTMSVKVAVRIRPLSDHEHKKDPRIVVNAASHIHSDTLSIDDIIETKRANAGTGAGGSACTSASSACQQKMFGYDHVFGPRASQYDVFAYSVLPLLHHITSGINVTVIAYGQTGSGKTFTMGTAASMNLHADTRDNLGIVPRAAAAVFDMLDEKAVDGRLAFTYTAAVSFLEIYNDDVIDLFDPRGTSTSCCTPTKLSSRSASVANLRDAVRKRNGGSVRPGSVPARKDVLAVRHGKANGTVVQGASHIAVFSVEDVERLLQKGTNKRQTAATQANATSSRSHAIFTITITQETANTNGTTSRLVSKLNFVDLAGSERLKNTQAVGNRAKEGISINAGLLALGKVINALAAMSQKPTSSTTTTQQQQQHHHVPYRDSIITRLLQDSLSGSSQILMIACVGPSVMDLPETKSTLQFASRARAVRIKATMVRPTVIGPLGGLSVCASPLPDTSSVLHAQIDAMSKQLAQTQHALEQSELRSSNLVSELEFKRQVCLDMQDHIESLLTALSELHDEHYEAAANQSPTPSAESARIIRHLEQQLTARETEMEIIVGEYQATVDTLSQRVSVREQQIRDAEREHEYRLRELLDRVCVAADRVESTAALIKPCMDAQVAVYTATKASTAAHTEHKVKGGGRESGKCMCMLDARYGLVSPEPERSVYTDTSPRIAYDDADVRAYIHHMIGTL